MDLILAEQLLLLMLDDEKGTNAAFVSGEAGPAGALLVDLTAAERSPSPPTASSTPSRRARAAAPAPA